MLKVTVMLSLAGTLQSQPLVVSVQASEVSVTVLAILDTATTERVASVSP